MFIDLRSRGGAARGSHVSRVAGADASGRGVPRPGARPPTRAGPARVTRVGPATEVHGILERFRDPACGCVVVTTFRGDLEGDRIRGTFTSYHQEGGERFTGEWEVERAGPDR